jgi:hypothetical protein
MKKWVVLLVIFSFNRFLFSQENESYTLKWGINADYSNSGITNTLAAGPALFWEKEKDRESGFVHAITTSAGFSWGKQVPTAPLTSAGYYLGNLPGLVVGISSQQYYHAETKYDHVGTDVRLSGEVVLALFGFLGYRYQHPLILKNESKGMTRHAFFVRIPIPVKTIAKK